ncbi:MAG: hypothetical protein AAF456_17135 [Planctomycetota bacterium]
MIRPSRNPAVFTIVAFLFGLLFCGCPESTETPETTGQNSVEADNQPPDPSTFEDGLSADQILQQSLQQYQLAEGYSDEAVLYLSYWMNGRPIQEPQPWSVSWHRSGKFAASFFNSQIGCDGQRLSCYVYDIGTANLDGQRLLLPASTGIPLQQLFTDEIASHFLGGESEFPLHSTNVRQAGGMIPPTTGLLTGQLRPEWLTNASRLVRMADAKVEKRSCYVIRCVDSSQDLDVWIDKQSGIIRQISYPVQWLDELVQTAPEISQLQFVARFHNAKFNPELDQNDFTIKQYRNSTPVRSFVKLPEAIPADTIGQPAPTFELFTSEGNSVDVDSFAGRTTALMWIGDWRSYPGIAKLDQIKSRLDQDGFNFGVVYADDNLASPGSASVQPNEHLMAIQQETEIPFYLDRMLASSTLLKMQSVPGVVILDRNLQVQFARELSDEQWSEDVAAALERTASGDDVAGEMLSDYRRFLDQYHAQLSSVVAMDLGRDLMPESFGAVSATDSLVASQIWSSGDFQQPGDITVTSSGRIFVLDGWRTIVEMDVSGKVIDRHELALPDNKGVSRIRSIEDADGATWLAAFMPSDDSIYLFDSRLEVVGTLPGSGSSSVLDCNLYQAPNAGEIKLSVALSDGGKIYSFPDLSLVGSFDRPLEAISGDGKFGVSESSLVELESGRTISSENLAYSTVSGLGDKYVAMGTDQNGASQIVLLDRSGRIEWVRSVGIVAETGFGVVASQRGDNPGSLAVAVGSNLISVILQDGRLAGSLDAGGEANGCSLLKNGRNSLLVTSSSTDVKLWEIEVEGVDGPSTIPASHQQER